MLYKTICDSIHKNIEQKICFEKESVTYGWLLQESQALSEQLTGCKYGIFCVNKMCSMIAILACLRAHKTAVLLCPEYGVRFNEKLIQKSKLKNFIINTTGRELNVITNDEEKEETLRSTAFIIHTSGSTGAAKGVMLTQDNVLSNIQSTLNYYPLDSQSSVLLYRPIYHTTTVFGEFLTSVVAGAKIYIEPSSMPMLYIQKIINKKKITHLAGTPTFFVELLKVSKNASDFSSVNVISVGGECMSKYAMKKMKMKFSNAQIYHCYGATETSPRIAYLPYQYFGIDYRCVGKPLNKVNVKLIDDDCQEVLQEYVVGEIVVQGDNIMQGYYRDEQATKKVLKDNWYHTGDLGYVDSSGMYYLIGRKDQMCIRAGVNVWPQDVEEEILRHPLVENVHVFIEHDERLLLNAQVVWKGSNENELIKWCVENMQKSYVPDRIEFVTTIQMSSCGKKTK